VGSKQPLSVGTRERLGSQQFEDLNERDSDSSLSGESHEHQHGISYGESNNN